MKAIPIRDPYQAVFLAAIGAFIYVMLVNTWVVDDAFITMRTVDNWVNGYGLTWNTSERVQAYTHPLWMLLLSTLYFFTRESYFTVLVACFVASLCAVLVSAAIVTRDFRRDTWKAGLVLLALAASKAVMDYTSSGLENALSYLIAALHLRMFLGRATDDEPPAAIAPFFWASLAYVNRPDSILLYLPALAYVVARHASTRRALAARVFVATLPATAWTLFSLVYYGFPFPNTAYAKSFVTGIPLEWKLERGLEYFANSFAWDAASHVMVLAALVLSVRRRSPAAMVTMGGVLLYMAGVAVNVASATHMSGRVLALPLFISIVVFVRLLETRRAALGVAAALLAYVAWNPVAPPKAGTTAYRAFPQNENFIDTRWYVAGSGAGLLRWRPGVRLPDDEWYQAGLQMRKSPQRVFVGGAAGVAIGYAGFGAGPDKFIIDRVGLSDPLLARLPAYTPTERMRYKSGHFQRFIPEGYVESVERDTNVLANPGLRKYYGALRNVTRGALFRSDRFKDIWRLNLGYYDSWLRHPASPGDLPAAPR